MKSHTQQLKIQEMENKLKYLNETMGTKISEIELQYNNVYSASKQNEQNFSKLYEEKTNNLKDNIQSNKYQLEKKLVQSKNLLDKSHSFCFSNASIESLINLLIS